MSLVSTYVKFNDGKYYKNPVIYGDGWYICFDDDEPPELVAETRLNFKKLIDTASTIGFDVNKRTRIHKCTRLYPSEYSEFRPSSAIFLSWKGKVNPTGHWVKHDGVFDKPKGQCVIYEGGWR